MARKRLSMRKTREILRLKYEAELSIRQIARSCGLASSTVSDYLRRAHKAKITWPLAEGVDDTKLDQSSFWAKG